jgi:hypothetical protein
MVSFTDSRVPSPTITLASLFKNEATILEGRVDDLRDRSSTLKNLALVSWSTVQNTEMTSLKV